MKRFIKLTKWVIIVGILIAGLKVYYYADKGYDMYQESISEVSFNDKIESIRNKENYILLSDLPEKYIDQLIASEDKRFYEHGGIDHYAISRAIFNDLVAFSFVEGGSTITQQLGKNIYFSFEKKFERKFAEIFLANAIEDTLEKSEILELYVNIIYFGENCYGIKEASEHYFGVAPSNLTDAQIKSLVLTIKSPNNYNPNKLEKVKEDAKKENTKAKVYVAVTCIFFN